MWNAGCWKNCRQGRHLSVTLQRHILSNGETPRVKMMMVEATRSELLMSMQLSDVGAACRRLGWQDRLLSLQAFLRRIKLEIKTDRLMERRTALARWQNCEQAV